MPFGEPTRFGWHVLPDNNTQGYGPIFLAVLQRAPNLPAASDDDDEEVADADDDDDGEEEGKQ
jgi:hypothetical protein